MVHPLVWAGVGAVCLVDTWYSRWWRGILDKKKGVCGQFFSQHTPINSQRFGTVALLFVGLDFARLQFLHVLIEVSANLTAQNVESQDVRKGHAENHDV